MKRRKHGAMWLTGCDLALQGPRASHPSYLVPGEAIVQAELAGLSPCWRGPLRLHSPAFTWRQKSRQVTQQVTTSSQHLGPTMELCF